MPQMSSMIDSTALGAHPQANTGALTLGRCSYEPLLAIVPFDLTAKGGQISFDRIQLLPCSTATTSTSIIKMMVSASS